MAQIYIFAHFRKTSFSLSSKVPNHVLAAAGCGLRHERPSELRSIPTILIRIASMTLRIAPLPLRLPCFPFQSASLPRQILP
ncbi:unnamed protein product [Closterium sp. NIES-64]|nr:unnamed protein product [Closterium sp. NIES-64]